MLRLAAVRRLHLDHRVTPGRPLQNVDPHVSLVRQKPGLVDRREVAPQGCARGRHLVIVLIDREIDQLAPGDVAPRALAHFPPLRKQVLLPRRRGQLRRVGLVHPPPQLLMTLEAGQIARLGEPERSEEHTSELQSQFHLVCRLLLEKKKHIARLYSLIQKNKKNRKKNK